MSQSTEVRTGGCLCGQIRYEARGEPLNQGHCYREDCRKSSGSGFIPFMGYAASAVTFSGETRRHACKAANGNDAVRNFCPACGGLVFGGIVGVHEQDTIYAGSLDDPSTFQPAIAIFTRGAPAWAVIPPQLTVFERAAG